MDPLAALLGRRRRAALVAAGVALAALIGLGAVVAGGTAPTGFDRVVRDWLAGWLGAGQAEAFADLGSAGVMIPAVAFAALVFALRRWFRGVLLVVASPVVAVVLTDLVAKPLFDRTSGFGLAYPSGHTAAVGAVALAVVVTATGPGRSALAPWRMALPVGASGVAVFLCAAGLVVAGYHYATDTIGGFALALTTVLLLAAVLDAGAERLRRRRTEPGAVPVIRPVEKLRR